MVRIAALLFSLVGSFALLGSAAIAQPNGNYYNVTLASEAAAPKTVVKDTLFSCNGATCVAGEATSRPAIICASIARELGPVTSFRAGEQSLDGEALAKCNAKADTTKMARR
ncbi:hypothetical protein HJG53_04235 [Sphingomonas sp. ID1715]|uniref:CC_3452 family protein n=1 Tax=Sphingomonas sp. ID1715 TaxID=1656898 RepID=UPI0014880F8F|nr:hypothetical protein [Sphingomonas sp. ID1715]NNM76117.1 hypothetical protein [Sphingomonas sp. ID1715]